ERRYCRCKTNNIRRGHPHCRRERGKFLGGLDDLRFGSRRVDTHEGDSGTESVEVLLAGQVRDSTERLNGLVKRDGIGGGNELCNNLGEVFKLVGRNAQLRTTGTDVRNLRERLGDLPGKGNQFTAKF